MKSTVYWRLSAPTVAGHSSYGNMSVRASVHAGDCPTPNCAVNWE